jgi:hypothetical protein
MLLSKEDFAAASVKEPPQLFLSDCVVRRYVDMSTGTWCRMAVMAVRVGRIKVSQSVIAVIVEQSVERSTETNPRVDEAMMSMVRSYEPGHAMAIPTWALESEFAIILKVRFVPCRLVKWMLPNDGLTSVAQFPAKICAGTNIVEKRPDSRGQNGRPEVPKRKQ